MLESQTALLTQPVTPSLGPVFLPSSPTKNFTSLYYSCHPGDAVTNKLLEECATLFSESYGVWGQNPTTKGPEPGSSPPFCSF